MFAIRTFSIPVLLILAAGIFVFRRSKDPAVRAAFLKHSGMAVMALSAGFFGLFVVGETFMDPGGWEAMGFVALWLVPMALLAAIGWLKPAWGVPILTACTVVTVALTAWQALDEDIRELEDRIGPVTMIVSLVVMVGAAALGHVRTLQAGIMLLAIGLAPFILWGLATPAPRLRVVVIVASSPALVTGVLYLLSDMVRAAPRGTTHPSPA